MTIFRPRPWKENGAATAELALLGTVLAPLLVATILVEELWAARLKLQEATRFAAWELTAFELSDYGSSNHSTRFDAALKTIEEEVQARWGDGDLDGATGVQAPTGLATRRAFLTIVGPIDLSVDRGDSRGPNGDAQMLDFGAAGTPGNHGGVHFGGGLDDILVSQFGFNGGGFANIRLTGTVRVAPGYNPSFPVVSRSGELTIAKGQLSFVGTSVQLLVDDWHLSDGDDVTRFSTTRSGSNQEPPYVAQVGRMAFLGLPRSIFEAVDGYASRLTTFFNVDRPLDPHRLVSRRYRKRPSSGQIALDVDGGQFRHHTTEIRTDISYGESEYAKTLARLGGGYMGCEPGKASAPGEGPSYPCDYP